MEKEQSLKFVFFSYILRVNTHAFLQSSRSHLGRERMLVELITIYAINAYQHKKL